MPPFVDIWRWFNGYRAQAIHEGNPDLLRLVGLFGELWPSLEPDPNRALALCNEAIALAQQIGQPCLELFYSLWRCETYLFYLHQIDVGLKESIKAALEAQKPEYTHCPMRARVYRNLVNAYHLSDPYGYAAEITAVLDYLENEVPLDRESWQALAWERAALVALDEDFERAFELAEVFRARCIDNRFYLVHAYSLLCEISYKLKRDEQVGDFAAAGEVCARAENRHESLGILLGWKAYALVRAGKKAEAGRAAAESVRQCMRAPALKVFRGPLVYYYEARGELDKALAVRREKLDFEIAAGSMAGEAAARLEICKLLAKMHRPLADELGPARAATDRLRRPEQIRAKLDRLEKGEILD